MELVSVTKVIQYLEEGYDSSTSWKSITRELLTTAGKELCQYVSKTERGFKLLEDFLNALQTLVKHNSISFQFLSDSGLIDVLGDVYQNVLQRLTKDGTTEGLQVIVEMLLEVTNVLGDLHSSAKSQICQGLCPHMLDLLQADKLEFQVKMEVVKSTNMLLDQCPTGTKDAILQHEDFQKKITNIVSLIKNIGDYEFQVGLVECLIRLFPRKSRQKYASQFLSDTMMLEGFLNIKDREFETDCRSFLNDLNSRMDSKKGVFSIPCVAAFVGNKQLRKPSDTGYDQFWVDFNIGSQRMTLFCEQDSLLSQGTPMDEQLWETVAIYKTDILKCSCCEIQGAIILEIGLKQRVCELYPSQHQDVTDNTVKVEFELEREMEIAQAVGKTFCFTEIRNKVSTVVDPIQISIREVQEQDSQSQLQESEDPEIPYQTNMVPPASQESTARRRKVSVPNIPMRTPTSTPIIPAAKAMSVDLNLCERSSRTLKDQAQKVSSTTAPLKISRKDETSVESKQAHNVTEMAYKAVMSSGDGQSLNEDDKKQHQTKETKKQMSTKQKNRNAEFAVPKTPVGVSKTSKPKVKTPVVTVTPPAGSKKKTKKKSAKEPKDNEQIVGEEKVKKTNIIEPESIPDSIPTVVNDVNDFSVSKEAFGSKNTTMDSGINLDESRASDSHSISELKEDIAIPLNDVKDNKACRVKGFENKRESRSKKNKKSNAENEMAKVTEQHIKKKHSKSNAHTNTAVQNETDLRPKTGDQDGLLENLAAEPVQQPISALKDDEDKFDFDSQQDKIPDSLEPSVEPNLKSLNERADKVQSKETSITEKYLKMLELKGMKNKGSRQSFDCDIVNEVHLKSSKHTGVIKKQTQSFTDLEPSLTDLYISDHKASSKQKEDKKSKGIEASKASTKAESNQKFIPASNFGKPKVVNSSGARQLRSRNENKRYKEIDESDSSLTEYSTDDSRKKKNVYDTAEFFSSKLGNANLTKKKKEDLNDLEKDKPANELPKGYKTSSETLVSKAQTTDGQSDTQDGYDLHHIAEGDNMENILLPYSYSTSKRDKDTNDARSNESSDISEDYRFNNSQESLDRERIPESQEFIDCLNSTSKENKRDEEKANYETNKACNLSAEFPAKSQSRYRKGTVDEILEQKDTKQKSVCEMKKNYARSKSKSAGKEFSDIMDADPPTNVKTKKHRKTQSTTECIEKSSSDMEKSLNNDCRQTRDEKKEKVKGNRNKERKEKNKCVTIEQNKESVEFKDVDGHLKQCKVNSVSKKKGKGFVFQMSYCRSETNYKYKNRYMSGASKSNLSNGYDPYDFTACENECVKADVENPGIENRNSLNYKKKPRKFFKHPRCNENNKVDCAHDETRINSQNQSRTSSKYDSAIEPPELNDSLVLSLTSPKEKSSKYKQKQYERRYYKTVSRKQLVENNCNTTDTDSADSLIISSDSPQGYSKNVKTKSKQDNTTKNKRKSNIQNKGSSHKKTNHDNITNAPMESNSTPVSPELTKDQTYRGRESVKKHRNKSHQSSGHNQIDNTINMESDDGSEISVKKCNSSKTGKGVKRRERKPEKASGKGLHGAVTDITSDDSLMISPDQSKTNRLLEQDPVTKKWYRKSDLLTNTTNMAVMKAEDYSSSNHPIHKKKSRQSEKEKMKPEPIDTNEIHTEIVEEVPLESDEMASQEENSFSKIVKDIVAARSGNNTKSKKKRSGVKCPLEKDDKENDNENDESCFKEFDTEIVDCIMEDVLKTPCVSASLASTPKVGSARRKHYNPLNISVIKTPVSLSKSVTFDDEVGGHDSEDDKFVEKTNNQNKQRKRQRKKPVQYKDLSDEEIDRDERLSQSSSRRSISSLLDSSNNISTRSEKSWILERKKPPKPKPKTYKCHKQQKLYNSQTESSEEDEPDDRSMASRSLSGLSGVLSLDIPTPSQSSVTRASKRQEDEDNLILTPVTPGKLSDVQCKAEDDIEVYQTQENCTLSLNMNKKHAETEDMGVSEIGSICLSALGVKTPQKHPQEEVDDNADLEEIAHKKLQESLKLILGDSGFASGPSSEVRPSRSTLKRKFPIYIMECESGSNPLSDEESTTQIEKPSILVPKKLFKFDHSSILETMNARSDTASTCSDTMEEQEDLEYPFQSGLSSFMTAFGADIQKHLNAKKQRFEELTKGVLKSTQKKFSSTWLEQQQYQSSVTEDFQAKMIAELAQLEADIVKMKEMEIKSEEFFKSQLEILHSSYISQTTRLANFKKMHLSYRDRARKVQKYNSAAHNNMVDQLRKEMTALQKKLIQETQKQELMNVRRGLQNLF